MASLFCSIRTGAHGSGGRPVIRGLSGTHRRQCRASLFAAADRAVCILRDAHIGTWARDCHHCSRIWDGLGLVPESKIPQDLSAQRPDLRGALRHVPATHDRVARRRKISNRGLAAFRHPCGCPRLSSFQFSYEADPSCGSCRKRIDHCVRVQAKKQPDIKALLPWSADASAIDP